jgi:electron transfer flavoprotein alpha subunit
MAGIWVFAENRDQTRELLNAGKYLAGQIGVKIAAFTSERELAQEYVLCGADEVFLLPPLAQEQPFEAYLPVLAETAAKEDPDVILIAATPRGKEIAARLAVRLNTGLCSVSTALRLDDSRRLIEMQRMIYGGAAIQSVHCTSRPQMATVPPRIFDPAPPQEGRQGKITEINSAPNSPVKVINRSQSQRESVDIREAKVIVCVGRGIEKQEDIALARELATVLRGEVGCSRPVAEELRWLPEGVYLGISGKKVKPDLYIGVGVSGQIQHVTGIRDSKVVFAINRDENAPIFDAADYGIVGDLYQVVPRLIDELKTALEA